MLSNNLSDLYIRCADLGLAKSKSDFSRRLLGRGGFYMRLIEQRGSMVSAATSTTLRQRLAAVAMKSPPALAWEIGGLIECLDEATRVSRWMRR